MLRILCITLCMLVSITSCKNKKDKPQTNTNGMTTCEVKEAQFNVGDIKQGECVSHTYKIKNTGDYPLVITRVESGCSCTSVRYPTNPIPAGEKGEIEVSFNSAGKFGLQIKEITIFANIPKEVFRITFMTNVLVD